MFNSQVKTKTGVKDDFGLSEYGFVKFPNCSDHICPEYDYQRNCYITGLDETSPSLLSKFPNKEERDKEKEKIVSERKELEELLGVDLTSRSKYWEGFVVPLVDAVTGKLRQFDNTNPKDRLAMHIAKATGKIGFGKDSEHNPEYTMFDFYIVAQDEEKREEVKERKTKRKLHVQFHMLFENQEFEKAFRIAYYLGLKPAEDISNEDLELMLEKMIFQNTDERVQEAFLEAVNKPNEFLMAVEYFKKAVSVDVIKFNNETKTWHRGIRNYGSTEADSIKYLLLPENASELNELVAEVKKRKKGRKLK